MKQMLIIVAVVVGAAVLTWVIIAESPDEMPPGFTKTNSGLMYKDTVVGTGKTAETGDTVAVHYKGTFKNGDVFDSSLKRNKAFEFELGAGGVIRGWDEGIVGMKEGGKRVLIIPSDLAYGPKGRDGIPPNSTLIFDVQLLKVK